jgi:hypothetical protein
MADTFVPDDFEVPLALDGDGFRLEPLGPEHNERDHTAWMSSIEHIRSTPGFPDGDWPHHMSLEDNLADLVRHAADFEERRGFTYSVLDGDEVIGCVYIYPSKTADADVQTWVTEARAGLDSTVRESVRRWLEGVWPFEEVAFPGLA